MKIESIIRREGGSHIHIGGSKYHFKELDDGSHVAEVEDQDHVDRLLAIPEGFRMARDLRAGVAIPKKVTPPAGKPPRTPPQRTPAPVPVKEPEQSEDAPQGDGQSAAGEDADGDAEEPNTPDEDGAEGDGETDQTDQTEQQTDDLATLDREALAAKYAEKFGAPPPANVSKKSLITALQ